MKFKKNPAFGRVTLPGIGRLLADRVLEGEQWLKFTEVRFGKILVRIDGDEATAETPSEDTEIRNGLLSGEQQEQAYLSAAEKEAKARGDVDEMEHIAEMQARLNARTAYRRAGNNAYDAARKAGKSHDEAASLAIQAANAAEDKASSVFSRRAPPAGASKPNGEIKPEKKEEPKKDEKPSVPGVGDPVKLEDLDQMTVAALREVAASKNIDLRDLQKKADIKAAVAAVLATEVAVGGSPEEKTDKIEKPDEEKTPKLDEPPSTEAPPTPPAGTPSDGAPSTTPETGAQTSG